MNTAQVAQLIGVFVAILGGTGGIVAWFKIRGEARKLNADAATVINDAASRAVLRTEGEIDRLTVKVRQLEDEINVLTGRLWQATYTFAQHNIPPPWQ